MTVLPEGLKTRALRAGVWSTLLGLAATALRFASSLIMTRLLVPDIFGVVALAIVFFTVVNLLSDVGLRQSIIYNKNGENREFLGTAWTISVVRGGVISALSGLLALTVYIGQHQSWFAAGTVYAHPDLPAVMALTGFTALIYGFKSPKFYVCERHLDLKSPGYIELMAQFAGAVATILLTLKWRTVWPIVAGSYVAAIATVLLSFYWLKGPIGRLCWNKAFGSEIVVFGRWIMLSSLAFVIASSSDRILFGFWFSPAILAFYALGLNIVQIADSVVGRPFASVGGPAFGEVVRRGGDGLKQVYYRFRLPYDLATVGIAGFLFSMGQVLIDILYDPRYTDAGHVLQILSFSLLFPRYNLIGMVYGAHGNPKVASWASVIRLVSVLVFVPVGYTVGGFDGALWAMALHMLPGSLFLWWSSRALKLDDLAFEGKVLLAWPAGAAIGWLGVWSLRPVLDLFHAVG